MPPVRIRLEAAKPQDLDAHEAALRTVLDLAPAGADYPNRRGPGARRYLESVGVRTTAAAGPADAPSPLAVAEDFKRGRDLFGEIGALRAADEDLERRPWFPLQPGDVVLLHLPADAHSPAFGQTFLAVGDDTDIAGNAMLREVSRTRSPRDEARAVERGPDYLLRYDSGDQRWVLDTRDLDDALRHWLDGPAELGRHQEAEAQTWAAGQIADIEGDRELTGWQDSDGGQVPVFADDRPDVAEPLTPFYELWFEAGPGRLTVIRAGALVHGRPATTTAAAAAKGA